LTHRAGHYSANLNTIKALKENDILIDSSYYYGHPNCKLKHGVVNQPFDILGVTELPVSVVCIRRDFPSIPLLRKVWYQRIDLKQVLNLDASQIDFSPVILTCHSFDVPSARNLDKVFKNLKKNRDVSTFAKVVRSRRRV